MCDRDEAPEIMEDGREHVATEMVSGPQKPRSCTNMGMWRALRIWGSTTPMNAQTCPKIPGVSCAGMPSTALPGAPAQLKRMRMMSFTVQWKQRVAARIISARNQHLGGANRW